MRLKDLHITPVVRCAPPEKAAAHGNTKLLAFVDEEIANLKNLRVVVCLVNCFRWMCERSASRGKNLCSQRMGIRHGAEYELPDGQYVPATYHPSLQNTKTGLLTCAMFSYIFLRARVLAGLSNEKIIVGAQPS